MKFLVVLISFCALYASILAGPSLDVHDFPDVSSNEPKYRLPNNTLPEHYDISLETFVDRDQFNFSGVVRIDVLVIMESSNITVHFRQLTIEKVRLLNNGEALDGVDFTYDSTREFLIISTGGQILEVGGKYILEVTYQGELRTDMKGFYRSSYTNDNGKDVWLATTQFESTDSRHAFPGYDEPAIKATFTIHIRHGATYKAISNMPGKTEKNSDGTLTTHFDTTPKMSSYLIAFIVSDFDFKKGDKQLVHRVFSAPYLVNQTAYALAEGEVILDAIAKYVNVPYTMPKMDQAAIPQFRAGAMENWGLVTYREEYLLFDKNIHSQTRQTGITTTIAHEFGHQWFGDLVSPKWWNYIWLNEGFATLFQHLGTDLVHPEWKIFDSFVVSTLQGIMKNDATDTTHPMTYYVESPEAVAALFDGITYSKSGSVLRMFLHALTESSFKKGLTIYLKKKSYQAAEENDLFAALDRAAKEDETLDKELNVKDIFSSWSHQKGFPLLNVSRNYEDGSVTLYQERYTSKYPHPEAKEHTWWIPYNLVSSSDADFDTTKLDEWVPAGNTSKRVELKKKLSKEDWIVLNKQQTGYYRVLYDDKNYELISNELNSGDHSKIHPLNRAQLLDDLKSFVDTGRVPPKTFFDMVSYLQKETDFAPWYVAKRALGELDSTLSGSDKQKVFHSFVASLVEPVYRKVASTLATENSYVDKNLRNVVTDLACSFGVKSCLDETRQQFEEVLSGRIVPSPDMRSLVFAHGVRGANEQQVKALWALFENSKNDEERKEIVSSIGNMKDEVMMKEYLDKSIQPSDRFSQAERQAIVQSVAFGSDFGLSSVMKLLTDNMDEAKKVIGDVDKILKKLVDRIVTSETQVQFAKLLKTAKDSKVAQEQDIEDMHKTIANKVNWVNLYKPRIENSIPVQKSSVGSKTLPTKYSIAAMAFLYKFAV